MGVLAKIGLVVRVLKEAELVDVFLKLVDDIAATAEHNAEVRHRLSDGVQRHDIVSDDVLEKVRASRRKRISGKKD